MEDRITVNMGAANLVVETHFDDRARREGLFAVYILNQQGKRVFPYVCPLKLPAALNAVKAAKGQVFDTASDANAWLESAWISEKFSDRQAA